MPVRWLTQGVKVTAFLKDAAIGLRDFLGYDANMHRHIRALTPYDEWVKILVDELQAGRPVLL